MRRVPIAAFLALVATGATALAQPAGDGSIANRPAAQVTAMQPEATVGTVPVAAPGQALPGGVGPTHRPLRAPPAPPDALPPPAAPETFSGWGVAAAAAFTVVPRKPELPLHPCSMCHDARTPDPSVRTFRTAPPPDGAPHAGTLRHGGGRFWCLDCHQAKDREWLRTLDGAKLDFDRSPILCGQCHGARYRDWAFGAHGKRVANWSGERQLYACTHCHDPHDPRVPARAPGPPPPVRAGLAPMDATHAPVWPRWLPAPKGDARAAR